MVHGLAHVRHFATHPQALGRGIGRMIFSKCIMDASKSDVTRFKCFSSLNAVAFYETLGFERQNRIDIQMGPEVVFPSIVMVMDVDHVSRQE